MKNVKFIFEENERCFEQSENGVVTHDKNEPSAPDGSVYFDKDYT